jgi:hypothetical protein
MTNDEKQSIINAINSMQRIGLFCEICRNVTCICKIGEDSSIINPLENLLDMDYLTKTEMENKLININKMKIKENSNNPLVGKWFHVFDKNELTWQGQIIAEVNGFYLVQLYDWVMGEATVQKIADLQNMVYWNFYDTAEDMRENYERIERKS